jgi:hypothetical protein
MIWLLVPGAMFVGFGLGIALVYQASKHVGPMF